MIQNTDIFTNEIRPNKDKDSIPSLTYKYFLNL